MQNLTGGSHKFNAEKILNEYQFDAFLIPKSTPLYRYLKTVYNLDVLYSDEDAVYFKLKGKKCEALEKNENNVKYTGTCKKT